MGVPILLKLDGIDGDPTQSREADAVSLNEILVTKSTDCGDGLQADDTSFVFDGTGGTVDGHVQYNPFVTVDTLEGARTRGGLLPRFAGHRSGQRGVR